jgi:hypothetical protein
MKLYNLYKDIILEAEGDEIESGKETSCHTWKGMTNRQMIEALIDGCTDANGKRYWQPVNIKYNGESKARYIFIHAILQGPRKDSKKVGKGNVLVMAWQTAGPSKSAGKLNNRATGERQDKVGWRTFNIKEIEFFEEPKEFKLYDTFDGYIGPQHKHYKVIKAIT